MFKKNRLWLLIVIFMPVLVNAQFDKLHIDAGVVFSSRPLFGTRELGGLSAPSSQRESLRFSPGLIARLMTGWQMSERLGIAIGLSYESGSYQYNLENLILPADIPRGTSTSFKQEAAVTRVGIPFQLTYRFGETRKVAGVTGLSIERTFTSKDQAIVKGAGAEDVAILNLRAVDLDGFNVFFSVGMDIAVFEIGKSVFSLVPFFSLGLLGNQVSYSSPQEANLYRAAVFLSYTHQL